MTEPAVTRAAVAAIVDEVARYGAAGVETGGFLLVPRSNPTVTTVLAMAGTAGITRRPDQFIVSGSAIEVLSEWADNHGLRVAAQFHSHATSAFLSRIDRRGGIRVNGFTSTVVPTFRTPPAAMTAWAWFTFTNGDWHPRPPLTAAGGGTSTITFDEDGTRDR